MMAALEHLRHDLNMAFRCTQVGELVVVRWGVPEQADCERLRASVTASHERAGAPLFCVLVLPYDLPALKDAERERIAAAIELLLPHSARVAVVVEARGFRGATLRSAVTHAKLAGIRRPDIHIVDSLANAFAYAPGPMPSDSLVSACLRDLGCALPPGLRVA